MDHFQYQEHRLHAEEVPVAHIAERFGTPCYVYSRATLERHWRAFDTAFGHHPHLICFAVKANSNLAVLNVLARMGSGFDIVSGGELERVLAAGGDPAKVIFSGVGKRAEEMCRALEVGIRCFNVESEAELERLEGVARALGTVAPVSIRVNPDVDAGTHPYISTGLRENKFGIDIHAADRVYERAAASPHLRVAGIDCHIGSQLTELSPFLDASRGSWNWRTGWNVSASPSIIWTWAVAWASATPTKPRPSPPLMPAPWTTSWRAAITKSCWSPAAPSPATPASC
jgi:diaminopimelate decarboxylase